MKNHRVVLSVAVPSVMGIGLVFGLLFLLGSHLSPVRAAAESAAGFAPDGVITVCQGGGCDYDVIQDAVDAAAEGDEIRVAAGMYTGVNEHGGLAQIVYLSKTVTIRGGYTAEDWTTSDPAANPTTLDAEGQGRVLYLTGDIEPTIIGLRITGGDADGLGGKDGEDVGGGIYVSGADPIITATQVLSNSAEWGGGVYLQESAAHVRGCLVAGNQAQVSGGGACLRSSPVRWEDGVFRDNWAGFGGGLFLYDSAAILTQNSVTDNIAGQGGGIYVWASAAEISENNVSGNVAEGGYGGGLYLVHAGGDVLLNAISGNTADYGGGLLVLDSNARLSENELRANEVTRHGGGLYLLRSDAAISGSMIAENRAGVRGGGAYIRGGEPGLTPRLTGNTFARNVSAWGGGLYLLESNALLEGNGILDNRAESLDAGLGGGLYVQEGRNTLEGNDIRGNSANWGGGIYLDRNRAKLVNTLLVDNQAQSGGSGLYVTAGRPRLLHTTLANNDGSGLPNVESKGLQVYEGSVQLTNTIVADHAVGLYVEGDGSIARLNSTLWHNDTDRAGDGTIEHINDYYGSPRFRAAASGDYHITSESAALDRAIDAGVSSDLDGHPRPIPEDGAGDLGMDECTGIDLSQSAKLAMPDRAQAGETVSFTLELLNSGHLDAEETVLFDPIPFSTTYISGSVRASQGAVTYTNGIHWSGTLVSHKPVTLTYHVTVDVDSGFRNIAVVTDQYGTVTTLTALVNALRFYLPLVLRDGR